MAKSAEETGLVEVAEAVVYEGKVARIGSKVKLLSPRLRGIKRKGYDSLRVWLGGDGPFAVTEIVGARMLYFGEPPGVVASMFVLVDPCESCKKRKRCALAGATHILPPGA